MPLAKALLKNFLLYFTLLMLAFLGISNVTLTIETFIDGVIKSFFVALLLLPFGMINYLGKDTALDAEYTKVLEFELDEKQAFKTIRTVLRTMIGMTVVDSDSENGYINIMSANAYIRLLILPLKSGKTEVTISSIPKMFRKTEDYNLYVKDLKNIVNSIALAIDENSPYLDELAYGESDLIMESQAYKLVYHKAKRLWLIMMLTVFLLLGVYSFALELYPSIGTVFLFIVLFLYFYYIFEKEISLYSLILKCPQCKKSLLPNKYDVNAVIFPKQCDDEKKCPKASDHNVNVDKYDKTP